MYKTLITCILFLNTMFISAQVPEELVMSVLPSCSVTEKLSARNTWIEITAAVQPQFSEQAMVMQFIDFYDNLWSNMPRCKEAMSLILVSLRMDVKFYAVSLELMEDVIEPENIQLQLAYGRSLEALNITIP